jgi:hypothetical protein
MQPECSLLHSSKVGSVCITQHSDTFLLTTLTVETQQCIFCVLFSYTQILCAGQQLFYGKLMSLAK